MKTLSFIPLYFLFLLSVEGPAIRPTETNVHDAPSESISPVTETATRHDPGESD